MKKHTLVKYVEKHGQTATSKALGITQGAVWRMINSGREITIHEEKDGSVVAFERKQIGKAVK